MDNQYEIPREGSQHLAIGNWVEIIEAYDLREATNAIRVTSMRVGNLLLDFASGQRNQAPPMRPHEGQVTHVECGPENARFCIRFS